MFLQILSAISALRKLIGWVIEGFKAIRAFLFQKKLKAKEKQTEEATKKLSEADLVEDDQKRLAEKAKAARELENSIRPN